MGAPTTVNLLFAVTVPAEETKLATAVQRIVVHAPMSAGMELVVQRRDALIVR